MLVFIGGKIGGSSTKGQLYLRRLDQLHAVPFPGTKYAVNPFFSPDGRWINYFVRGAGNNTMIMKRVSVAGGLVQPFLDHTFQYGAGNVASWTIDGIIVAQLGNLFYSSAAGGKPELLEKLSIGAGGTPFWPQLLPGGKAVLFTDHQSPSLEMDSIAVKCLPDGPVRIVQQGGYAGHYLPSGHLVFIYQGKIFAAPFSLERLDVTAPPVSVAEGVLGRSGRMCFSDNGTMVYQSGPSDTNLEIPSSTIDWLESSGKTIPLQTNAGRYTDLSCSPDGKRLAVRVYEGGKTGIFIYEWERRLWSRLTQNPRFDRNPLWAPDGSHIVFGSDKDDGTSVIYWMRSGGTGEAQRLVEHPLASAPTPGSFSPDGKKLAYHARGGTPSSSRDIFIVTLDLSDPKHPKAGKPERFSGGGIPSFSPDGHWLAFSGGAVDKLEVIVVPFPGPGGRFQVSSSGGSIPKWSRTGQELFFTNEAGQIMVAAYTVQGGTFVSQKPRLWSEKRIANRNSSFDMAPDGRRFAVITPVKEEPAPATTHLVLVQNFFEELRRKVPVGNGR